MRQQVALGQTATLHQGKGAGGAQSSGRIGLPTQTGSNWMWRIPAQKHSFVLQLETGQRTAEGVLGPALRIALHRIVEEAIEGGQQFGGQIR